MIKSGSFHLLASLTMLGKPIPGHMVRMVPRLVQLTVSLVSVQDFTSGLCRVCGGGPGCGH